MHNHARAKARAKGVRAAKRIAMFVNDILKWVVDPCCQNHCSASLPRSRLVAAVAAETGPVLHTCKQLCKYTTLGWRLADFTSAFSRGQAELSSKIHCRNNLFAHTLSWPYVCTQVRTHAHTAARACARTYTHCGDMQDCCLSLVHFLVYQVAQTLHTLLHVHSS